MENHKNRKKIQMDYQQCTEHSATEDGAQPLTNPECVRKSSKDVNRGLYPQQSLKGQRDMQPERYKTNMPQSTGPQIYSPQSVHKFETPSEHASEMSSPKRKLPEEFTSLAKLKIISPLNFSKASFSNSQLTSKYGYGSQHDAWRSSENDSRSAPGCSKMTRATKYDASTSGGGSRESVQPARRNLFNNELALRLPSESNDPNLLAFEEDSTDEELMICASVEAEKRCSTRSLDTNLEPFESDSFLDELSPTMLENMETEKANTHGLLGGSSNVDNADETGEDENVEYLTSLPDKILEKIFSYLSISVCCHICVVCKRWSRIILKPQFLPWKKLYQRYKYSEESGVSAVGDIYTTRSFGNDKSCLLTLIRYMSEFKTINQSSTVGYMSRHPMFQVSCDLLAERAPDLVVEGVPNLWSLLATMVILSRSTHDISEAIKYSLQSPWEHSTIIESFYRIATMLLMLQNKHSINCGLHYRLYHALYHYESGSSLAYSTSRMVIQVSSKDSLKMQNSGHVMTQEQVAIISYKLKPKEVVKIIAFAGTGKTSTLIKFTLRNPNMSFLYVAFNKSVEEQAKRSFPSNVQCRTTHSLAYGAVGYRYKNKLIPNLKIYNVVCMLEPKATSSQKKNKSLYVRAKLIIKTIKNFMASDDADMMLIHVPEKEKEGGITGPSRQINPERRKGLLMEAKKLWERMHNVSDREASVTHDAYLKFFQLTEAKLPSVDCILIDEAQDLTPAQQDILLRQDCAKIVVGDPHQQIYSFRGATNALRNIPATKTFHLTQSFRFGPEIAYVANSVLHALKNVKKYVIGVEALGSVLGEEVGQVAVICRTNLSLFNEAAKLCEQNETVTIGLVGGVRSYRFDQILDIYKLYSFSGSDKRKLKNEIKDKFIQCYSSISQLQSYADDVEDIDLLGRIQIVKKHRDKIPEHIERIKSRAVDDITKAEVVFSTAHKAKGLEFDTVKVTCDYMTETNDVSLPGFGGIPIRLQMNANQPVDELNLLYVALTRAKKRLKLTSPILKLLARLNETFSYPVSTKAVSRNEDGVLVRCVQCSAEIESNKVLAFERLKVNLGYSTQAFRPPGFLCSRCAGAENVGFSSLVSH